MPQRVVYTLLEIDMETLQVTRVEGYLYNGPWEECKEGAQQQAASQQLTLNNQLVQQMLAQQKGMVTPAVQQIQQLLASGQGFDPAMLANMRAQSIQNTGGQFANAIGATKEALARRGLAGGGASGGASGLFGQGYGGMEALGAQTQSQNLGNIDIQNAQQRLQNIWNGANALGGLAGLFSPSPFVGGANSALGSWVQAGSVPSFGSSFMNGLGGSLGGGLGKFATGGLGGGG